MELVSLGFVFQAVRNYSKVLVCWVFFPLDLGIQLTVLTGIQFVIDPCLPHSC